MTRFSALLVVGSLLAPGVLPAQQPGPPPEAPRRMQGRQGEGMGPGMAAGPVMLFSPGALLRHRDRLSLTDEQVTQLEALASENRMAGARADSSGRGHADRLQDLWKADKPDANAIRREMEALIQSREAAGLTAATNAAKAKGLLTSQQIGRIEGWVEGRRAAARRSGGPPPRGEGRGYRAGPRMRRY